MAYPFNCRLCKNHKQGYEKRKLFLYDTPNDMMLSSDVCANCFYKLKAILQTATIIDLMKQQSLDVWKLEI